MSDARVLGEWVDDLAKQLMGLKWAFDGDVCRIDGKVPPQGPVMRAWLRAEAELLVDDATDMSDGRYVPQDGGAAAVRSARDGVGAGGGRIDPPKGSGGSGREARTGYLT